MTDIVADLRKAGNDDEACGGTLDLWPCRFSEEIIKAAAKIEALRIALADAIRRPMGVIPASAEGLITDADLDAAEKRRPRT